MADRGLRAYAVPSARAGQRPDPAARRDALAGLLTGGFLVAIIVAALVIVLATPQYARPAMAEMPAVTDGEPVLDDAAGAAGGSRPVMTSDPPSKLKGYRWPLRGGFVVEFYGKKSKTGRFEIEGKRIDDGIAIDWFEGAEVRAAHGGTVVAAGRGWIGQVGYRDSIDVREIRDDFDKRARRLAARNERKPERFPFAVVIDDGNGYRSVYSGLKDVGLEKGDVVKRGQVIGRLTSGGVGRPILRYRLVRMDGHEMRVHESDVRRGYPGWARERIDPLAVLPEKGKKPKFKGKPPKDPPRLSEY